MTLPCFSSPFLLLVGLGGHPLSLHDSMCRVNIIQRRQALRQKKMERQVQERRKRVHVMNFLSNLESSSGEAMQVLRVVTT